MSLGRQLKSQSGFSLVELMVVVAIIGILAAIAIPNMQKYMAKSRQSEAKSNLASIYTAEKAFFAEYNTYDSRFQAIGFSPEGKLRYNIGFTAAHVIATAANGWNNPAIGTTHTNATAYCGAAGAINVRGCAMVNGATGAAPPALTGTAGTQNTFIAGTAAIIVSSGGGLTDRWTINEFKEVINSANGIP